MSSGAISSIHRIAEPEIPWLADMSDTFVIEGTKPARQKGHNADTVPGEAVDAFRGFQAHVILNFHCFLVREAARRLV